MDRRWRIARARSAIGRIAIGAGLLALPRATGGAWLGEPAEEPGGQLAVASLGARDLALGAGDGVGARRPQARPAPVAARRRGAATSRTSSACSATAAA